MIDELKIEDLKQQFKADADQCSNLPNKLEKIWAISTEAKEIHFSTIVRSRLHRFTACS